MATVDVRGATKSFGGVRALDDLSLQAPAGRITVMLGPNGAGKTTAIRLVTGAMGPDVGQVRTFGLDPVTDGEEVRRRTGVVSAKPALYDRLSGWDNLTFAANLYGLRRDVEARIRHATDRFAITHALDQRVGGYSTGMKTRLALSRAVLHEPALLLLDEPTSGLDPESSQAVLQLIRDMTADGTTVIMCTHLLAEAEGLADQIVMLDAGRNLLQGSQEELIARFWPRPSVRFGAENPELLDGLAAMTGVAAYRREAPGATVEVDAPGRVPELVAALIGAGARLTRVEPHRPSLEDLYFAARQALRPNPEQPA